jgi:hypothetical protein
MLGMRGRAGRTPAAAAVGLLVVLTMAGWTWGQPPGGGRPQGPPPEAVEACEGKSPGDAVQIQTPEGQVVSGTCRQMPDGRLVAGPPGGPEGHLPGPPPETFQACEGRRVGDTVQIRTPRGERVTATCRLVAVPQR